MVISWQRVRFELEGMSLPDPMHNDLLNARGQIQDPGYCASLRERILLERGAWENWSPNSSHFPALGLTELYLIDRNNDETLDRHEMASAPHYFAAICPSVPALPPANPIFFDHVSRMETALERRNTARIHLASKVFLGGGAISCTLGSLLMYGLRKSCLPGCLAILALGAGFTSLSIGAGLSWFNS